MNRSLRGVGVAAVLLAALFGFVPAAAAQMAGAVEGAIAAVDLRSDAPKVQVRAEDGKLLSLRVDLSATAITKNGARAKPEDLQVGQTVRIRPSQQEGQDVAQSIEILSRGAAPEIGRATSPRADARAPLEAARAGSPRWYEPGDKLLRGLGNFFLGFLEVPRHVTRETQNKSMLYGWTAGLGKGLGVTTLRMLVGVYETLTFPFAGPQQYGPIIEPEFPWAGSDPEVIGEGPIQVNPNE